MRGRLANGATTATLVFAGGAGLALAAKLVCENRWTSLICGDSRTLVLDRLLLAVLTCSLLAVVAGIAAFAGHSEHKGRVVLGVLVAVTAAALILLPDALGRYRCGIITANSSGVADTPHDVGLVPATLRLPVTIGGTDG